MSYGFSGSTHGAWRTRYTAVCSIIRYTGGIIDGSYVWLLYLIFLRAHLLQLDGGVMSQQLMDTVCLLAALQHTAQGETDLPKNISIIQAE